jgi:hypothetical protein
MALEYEPLDMAEVATEAERVNAEPGAGNTDWMEKFVKLPDRDGFVLMRILPRKKGQKLYCATRTHRLTNPSETNPNKRSKSLHCPKELVMTDRGPRWQGECIICKYYSDLWQKSEKLSGKAQEDLQQKAREIKPVERYYYNVIVRQEKQKDGTFLKNVGPKIFSCGKTVHAKIMRAIVGDQTAGEKPLGDITHPQNGRDFRLVKKVVKGGGGAEYPNYDNSKFEDVSPLGEMDDMEQWISNLHDLQALRVLKEEDVLKHELKVHLGLIKEEGTKDDLAEFRGDGSGSTNLSASTAEAEETVREELTTKPEAAKAEAKKSEEDVLADDDFMKELGDMQ